MFGSLFFYEAKVTPAISDNRIVITAFAAILLAGLMAGGPVRRDFGTRRDRGRAGAAVVRAGQRHRLLAAVD